MIGVPLDYTLDAVIARLRELAEHGHAPGMRRWNVERGPGLPSHDTLARHGHNWLELCRLAGLEPAMPGGVQGDPRRLRSTSRAAFEAVDAEVRHRFATAEPPRPNTWPLMGIPTRQEIKTGRLPDGTLVRVYRYYYSLR